MEAPKRVLLLFPLICVVVIVLNIFQIKTPSIDEVPPRLEFKQPEGQLQHLYRTYSEAPYFDHWLEYAEHYEMHISILLRNKPKKDKVKLLEIGVQSGGSARVWKQFFKDRLYYVGFDFDGRCKRSERKSENIFVEIGSQLNPPDLLEVCRKHGPFDIVIDDGGHTRDMMATTLSVLFPNDECMNSEALYIIEDMHTLAMTGAGGGYSSGQTDIPKIVAEIFRKMHYYWMDRGEIAQKQLWRDQRWADRVQSVSLYNSMMFLHRRQQRQGKLTRVSGGWDSFINHEKYFQPEAYSPSGGSHSWDWEPFLDRNVTEEEEWVRQRKLKSE